LGRQNRISPVPTDATAGAPPRLEPTRSAGLRPLPPRHIDRIATEAQGRFVRIAGGCALLALLWAGFTDIDRVTRGGGRIIPQQQKQEVQHLEGGIISEILVKEGERVAAGQPLMRIENTFFRSELTQARIELAAKRLKMARLEAEAAGRTEFTLPPDFGGAESQAIANEVTLFQRRRSNLDEQMSILDQQGRQKEIELSSLRSRQPLVVRERQIADERLASLKKLSAAGAASTAEMLEADRNLQQTLTRLSDLAHDIPRAEAALAEIGGRKQQLLSNFQAEAERDRTALSTEIDKLIENIAALEDRLKRSDVIAPVAGVINKLNVTTVGGVVKSGEALAEIVPLDASIGVEMRLPPADRANVWPGERAIVKVSAYEYTQYGALPARVVDISPDALQDERGAPYFRVRLEADAADFGASHPVLPGMIAEVDVIGERQSVLSSLLKPLRRMKDNALRQ
jgi:HlyD family type I secretion membrane fusion protein